MTYTSEQASVFIPDGVSEDEALSRTTHLCIGAHQDDQEFMAYHGVAACYGRNDQWFAGVTVTNGSGSARTGLYADVSDADMMEVRRREQCKAAMVGEYGIQIQLGYPSKVVKDPADAGVTDDLERILRATCPASVYLHNPADKHDTHVAVFLRCLRALRRLPADQRPKHVYGCEIWRGLDWLLDEDKAVLPTSAHPNLAAALSGVFDSQIAGGKRYDLAVQGRGMANATFFASHTVDEESRVTFAMDLLPLLDDADLNPLSYTLGYIDRLRTDVGDRMARLAAPGDLK